MDLKAVGQRIKMAREAKGLTQEDLPYNVKIFLPNSVKNCLSYEEKTHYLTM